MKSLLDSLILHPLNRQLLDQFVAAPAHALLLTAPSGSGKYWLAKNLSTRLLGLPAQEAVDSYPYFIHVAKTAERQEITIDDIRGLIHKLRLKTTGSAAIRRIILIEDAHLMSLEAQTAILKILEEPPLDTVFILTATALHALLPTVVSRSQRMEIFGADLAAAQEHFAGQYSQTEITKAWSLSGGRVGLLTALLADEQTHPLKAALSQVKQFMAATDSQRLLFMRSLDSSRADLAAFIEAAGRIMQILHHQALANNKAVLAAKLEFNRRTISQSRKQLAANVQVRLIGLNLALNLRS